MAQQMGPKLSLWLLASGIAAGIMLFVSPVKSAMPVVVSTGLLLLAPAVFLLGWMTGMSVFGISCDTWRRLGWNGRLVCILPILLCAIVALGFLGGRYWWLFSLGVAFLGQRKGTQRAWWGAVAVTAFSFRNEFLGRPPLAETDAQALAMATDSINKQIGRRPGAGA
jgi:hypothetical protein